ncbi:MAG TPA: hypothetical protein VFT22_25885 [Kofleriaceae bacterium]|nr:hypothetical protein [Kofleriaceae bacterium]
MKRTPTRRTILRGAALGALAISGACRRSSDDPHAGAKTRPPAPPRTIKDDLRHLVRVIGPWPAAASAQAEAILPRYLSDDRVKRFEPDRAALAQLATRFADHPPAAESIELAGLPAAERAALLALTADLYSVMQVRFAVAGMPEPGECMGDPAWQAWVPPA